MSSKKRSRFSDPSFKTPGASTSSPSIQNSFYKKSSSASSNKRSMWKRLHRYDPSVTSLCVHKVFPRPNGLTSSDPSSKTLELVSVSSASESYCNCWNSSSRMRCCSLSIVSTSRGSRASRYAFGRENPLQGYEELSGKVVRYAAGLPLTLKVLGSFLCGKGKLEWVDAVDRLEKIPLKDTLEKLELSYISLEDDYKEIFLDIACILKGQSKKNAIRILENCGFHAINGLKVLEQRSLITVDEFEFLRMHDHIEEMGKNIVRREHPDEPNKHSHLWIEEEIEDILANDMVKINLLVRYMEKTTPSVS
nr:Toll/interleukin-1 receptor (TIR) domain-containing protein [Tanacetum cinerariifolium]